MRKLILHRYRILLFSILLLVLGQNSFASHVVGADLHYTWISGTRYKITLIVYGDCGPASASAFSTLPSATPTICVYDGSTSVTSLTLTWDSSLNIRSGKEITPVCPRDSNSTQCHSSTSSIPGIKQFGYSTYYDLGHRSANWRFMFNGAMGASSTGRAAAITNISGGTTTRLVATLNNQDVNNSNPVLTIVPTPFFCLNNDDYYTPGGIDADGDSLVYSLVPGATPSGACGAGPTVTYIGGHSATDPLSYTAGSYSFDWRTGLISFHPNVTQRALVVYNIEEWRGDTLVGTSQREMTFLVIACSTAPPTGQFVSDSGGGTIDDPYHFHICANTTDFALTFAASETDTTNELYIRNTGLPPGMTFTVYGDSTNHAVGVMRWSSSVTPGSYVIYVIVKDNACPIQGIQTIPVHIDVLPVPALAYTIISQSDCVRDGVVSVTPGGMGAPWRVTLTNAAGTILSNDSGLTSTYLDTIAIGCDTFTIYSAISSYCFAKVPICITQAPFPDPTVTFENPTYCGANDGVIHLTGLNATEIDTIRYNYNGSPVSLSILTTSSGTYDITGLCAGVYNNITVNTGRCHSNPRGPYTLVNPGFTTAIRDYGDPSACGYNDGYITLNGLHPGQFDTVHYLFNGTPSYFTGVVLADSSIRVPSLLQGVYTNIWVSTTGACASSNSLCVSNFVGPVTLTAPTIHAEYTTSTHLGCNGDTVFFNNLSTPAGLLTYRWWFGDYITSTDTAINPRYIYHPTTATTYATVLYISNGRCVDSFKVNVSLQQPIDASYTIAPDAVCQGTPMNFVNGSLGVGNTYKWYFGDGGTSTDINPTYTYNNTGNYKVVMFATDNIGCKDTFIHYVQIDSNSVVSLSSTDTVFCVGGAVTFQGTYTDIGLTNVAWSMGDGTTVLNRNPVQHAYETPGTETITLDLTYRLCPPKHVQKTIRVYSYPRINLGQDSSICQGGEAITLGDFTNAGNPAATWKWNNEATTAAISISKAGQYVSTVTINGCASTDTVEVTNDCYVDLPNIFSPNDDGVNDYFFPREYLTKGITAFSMDIYNRWGQLVYQTTSIEGRGWDGKLNSIPQPEGVYIYVIKATFKDGRTMSKNGNITLLR